MEPDHGKITALCNVKQILKRNKKLKYDACRCACETYIQRIGFID